MNHFFRYHLIAVAVYLISYTPAFFLPATRLLKGFSNYTMFLFPLLLLILMIRTYTGERKLPFWEKGLYALTMVALVTGLNTVFGFLNLPAMEMNEGEKKMGIIGINVTYGIFELLVALVVVGVIKQKRSVPIANTLQA
jgi:hypothetical protein